MFYYVNPLLYFHSTELENNFVFNGLNGAVDILNRELAKCLSSNIDKYVDICSEDVDVLKERNYIFLREDDYKELRTRIESYQHEFLEKEPYHISILPTFACNLACPYCFEHKKPAIIREDAEYLNCLINALHFFAKKGAIVLELYGGEPLLPRNANIIEGVLSECEKINVQGVGVITNGTYLKEFSYLASQYPKIRFDFQVTIDGPQSVHNKRRVSVNVRDSFSLIVEGIDSVIDNSNVFIQIRTNVDKSNAEYLSDLYSFFEDKYASYKNIIYYATPTSDRDNPENDVTEADIVELLETLPRINGLKKAGGLHVLSYLYSLIDESQSAVPMYSYCEGVRGRYFALAPDGNIYSCGETVGVSQHSVGQFDSSSVTVDYDKLKKWTENTISSREDCKNCPLCFICGGGCALSNFMQTGKYNGNAACTRTHGDVRRFFDYLRKRAF